MNDIELCRKLIAIDSSIQHGTKDIVSYVSELAMSWGLDVEIQKENYDGMSYANILVRVQSDEAKQNLLMVCHLDTDSPGEYAKWNNTGANPYNASLNGDLLYGLGVADAKADFTCKLLALKDFSEKKFSNVSPVILGTFGLSSGAGTIRFIRKNKLNIIGASVGGPTEHKLACKGPGYAKVEIAIPFTEKEKEYNQKHNSLEGSVSQSKIFSRAENNKIEMSFLDNPIIKLIHYLKKMPDGVAIISVDGGSSATTEPDSAFLELDIVDNEVDGAKTKLIKVGELLHKLSIELKSFSDEVFSPSTSTLDIGMIRTYPDEIKMTGYCRLIPVEDKTRGVYDSWLEKLRNECADIGVNFCILDFKPPFAANSKSNIIEEAKLLAESHDMVASQNCTEANVFSRLGIDCFVYGPGAVRNKAISHISNGSVHVNDLVRAKEFYTRLIERVCK